MRQIAQNAGHERRDATQQSYAAGNNAFLDRGAPGALPCRSPGGLLDLHAELLDATSMSEALPALPTSCGFF
ncbi:MAG: hypothetical protein WBC04_03090 [Candidatus Acidiferrales bacterium]